MSRIPTSPLIILPLCEEAHIPGVPVPVRYSI
jgi:hypothetical protein